MESRIVAGARTLRQGRCAAPKMGIERERATRISGAHQRRAEENLAQHRRADGPVVTTSTRSLSIRDRGAVHGRADGRRQGENLSVDTEAAGNRGHAASERRSGAYGAAIRLHVRGAQKRLFHDVDCGMPSQNWLLYEFRSEERRVGKE